VAILMMVSLPLLLPLNDKIHCSSYPATAAIRSCSQTVQTFHRIIQSVGATGGVYKGQGRNQRALMTHAY